MNIEDYAGVQPINSLNEDGKILVFYMNASKDGEGFNFSIKRAKLDPSLTYDEMVEEVKTLLNSFPVSDIECTDEQLPIHYKRLENRIAQNTRRGSGNTRYENSVYYRGVNAWDCPIIVGKFEDKYCVFKHPNFDQYGFVVNRT